MNTFLRRTGFFLILLMPMLARAASHATATAALNWTALQPGQQAVLAVTTEIKAGFHAQSHTPSDENFIKFVVRIKDNSAIKAHEPVYPKGKNETYGALGTLNVYTGQVTVYVPLDVNDAPPSDVKLTGEVFLQCCDDKACFAPETLPFEVATKLAAVGETVAPANGELFRDFDPSVFAKLRTEQAAPAANTPGATSTKASKDIQFDVFGRQFTINVDSYGVVLSLAFGVGVIFNLMPCVLPVLPLKAIGFYEVSQHKRARSFLFGSIFSLGIVTTFALLGCLVLLRSHSWGDLFAKAWFVWGLALILVLMAASLFGLYTFRLPMGAYTFEPRHDTYSGNFLFGGLTAILSTPCTAPLFPGLLAWAAAQPSKWIGVFMLTMVGVGMASPYLVLSAVPELARKFPRTGPWSELVKQMLGFMVLSVAVFIAGQRLFAGYQFWAIFAVLLAGSVFLVVRSAKLAKGKLAVPVAVAIAILLSGASLALAVRLSGSGGSDGIAWKQYDDEDVNAARHTGKLVVIEFTAKWCANCLTLEATVFRKPEVAEAFKKYNVMAFRADLTEEQAPGFKALTEFNQAGGIPLTVIFAPNSLEPIKLSSLYSAQNLLDALEKASRTAVAEAK